MKKTLRKLTRVCDGCAPVAECPILESLDGRTHEQQVEAKHLGSPSIGVSVLPNWLVRRAGLLIQGC